MVTDKNSRRPLPAKTGRFKARLLATAFAGAAAAGAMTAAPAFAQDADDAEKDTVVVTGTRLAISPEQSPTPLAVLDNDYISLTGETNLADVLRELPASGSSAFTATSTIFSSSGNGINAINLRNLGSNRTVVLVNGRRYVSGVANSSIVDFNTIPTDFIERAEVITGGASAQYGADAVAGVINLITKKSFDGVQFGYQYGIAPSTDDNQRHKAYVTVGDEFASGRGGFILNFTYDNVGEIKCLDRDWCRTDTIGALGGDVQLAPVFSSFGPLGRFDVDGGGSDSLTSGDDLVVDPVTGEVRPFNLSTDGFNRSARRIIQIPLERMLFAANANYDLSDNLSFFFEGMYSNVNGFSQIEPDPADTNVTGLAAIPVTNPFCPAEICDAAIMNGQTEVAWARRMLELGDRGQDFDRDTFRFAAGFNGTIFNDVDFELSYVHGRVDDDQLSTASVDKLRLREALDAESDGMGGFQCADDYARSVGCVPINLFGLGAITPAAADWVRSSIVRNAFTTQQVATFWMRGNADRLFTAPGGSVAWSGGVEYRKEKSGTDWDSTTNIGGNSANALPDVSGQYDVLEGFFEAQIPFVTDASWTKDMSISGAVRKSEYSTIGAATAWNLGLVWAPTEDIRFRAKRAVAVRAPSIGELFSPLAQTFPTVNDPCEGVTAVSTGTFDDACRAIPEVAAAIARDGSLFYTQELQQSVTGYNGGNPDLGPEKARSWTAGVALTPRWVDNLGITVDYYRINLTGAIQPPSRDVIISDNALTGAFADLIYRGSMDNAQLGRITRVDAFNQNLAQLFVEGLDVGVSYSVETADAFGSDFGELSFAANYQHLFDLYTDTGTGPDFDAGEEWAPKDQVNANLGWRMGPFRLQYNVKWTGKTVLDDIDIDIADFAPATVCDPSCSINALPVQYEQGPLHFSGARISDYFQHDIQARWAPSESVEFYVGVNNLFNKDPWIIAESTSGNQTSGLETDGSNQINQIIGRYLYFGFTLRPDAVARGLFK
ncbi:MAG: TonB-dependent receptor [Parvularculaceae bacterium]